MLGKCCTTELHPQIAPSIILMGDSICFYFVSNLKQMEMEKSEIWKLKRAAITLLVVSLESYFLSF